MADVSQTIALDQRHIKALAALEAECFATPWSEADFAKALGSPYFSALGIPYGDELAAYISLSHPPGGMEVLNVATRGAFRRRGLARRLLKRALDLMPLLGADQVFLEVREHNIPARNLYAGLGFRQCGRRKAYYRDSGEDALILCYASSAPPAA